jgi:hypothetical protein
MESLPGCSRGGQSSYAGITNVELRKGVTVLLDGKPVGEAEPEPGAACPDVKRPDPA